MATVTEAVKESLIGTTTPEELSPTSRVTFMQYAKQDGDDEERYMGEEEFLSAIAPKDEDYHKIKREEYRLLFNVADRRKEGKVNITDWAIFQKLLSKPDAEYEMVFRLFDVDGTGTVKTEQFQKMYKESLGADSMPFNWDSDWASLYLGGKRHRHEMSYDQFAQMMRGLQGERVRQAFHTFDKDGDGYIEPDDFERIIRATASHKLSDYLLENLPTLCTITSGNKISYANVRAFQNVIREMDLLDLIIRNATLKSTDGKITRTDFLNEAARLTKFSLFTPMEADILFHFAGLDAPSGRLGLSDFARVIDASWQTAGAALASGQKAAAEAVSMTTKVLHQIAESAHHFALGSVAGAFGAFMVYPIDLVKTRMQNQRSAQHPGQSVLYANSIDCAKKIFRNEGARGLYAGVLPQLVGVAPEKAIKLTVNDLVRGHFTDKQTNAIPLWAEIMAGGSAGMCQVIFTNPLEIVKIRLQVQGELAKKSDVPKRSAMWIVKNLGVVGLYKGVTACMSRDVPFSAIYFPAYNHLKRDVFGESPTKQLGILQLLTAGAIAGMPAAYLTTPFDVVKTRLQVEARKGDSTYSGMRDCFRKVYAEEGFKAFFKGGPARVLRSSPQFAFTLAGYEVLSKLLPMPGSDAANAANAANKARLEPGVGLREATAPLGYLRARNVIKVAKDIDSNLSLRNLGKIKVPSGPSWQGLPFGMPGST